MTDVLGALFCLGVTTTGLFFMAQEKHWLPRIALAALAIVAFTQFAELVAVEPGACPASAR